MVSSLPWQQNPTEYGTQVTRHPHCRDRPCPAHFVGDSPPDNMFACCVPKPGGSRKRKTQPANTCWRYPVRLLRHIWSFCRKGRKVCGSVWGCEKKAPVGGTHPIQEQVNEGSRAGCRGWGGGSDSHLRSRLGRWDRAWGAGSFSPGFVPCPAGMGPWPSCGAVHTPVCDVGAAGGPGRRTVRMARQGSDAPGGLRVPVFAGHQG